MVSSASGEFDHAVRAVLVEQAQRGAEDAAARADIFAGDEHAIVARQLLVHRLAEASMSVNSGTA